MASSDNGPDAEGAEQSTSGSAGHIDAPYSGIGYPPYGQAHGSMYGNSPQGPYPNPYPQAPGYAPYPPPAPYGGYPAPGYPQPYATQYPPLQPMQPVPPKFGAVGVVPWTFRQTLLGAAITLVPWVAILVLTQFVSPQTAVTHPLPRAVDAIGAVISLVISVVVEGFFLVAPAYYALFRRPPGVTARDGLRALGIRTARLLPSIGTIVLAVVTVLVASVLYGVAIQVFHLPLQTNADVLMQEARVAPLTTIATLAGAVLVAPFCEEIFFRGYLFGGLLRGMRVWQAVLVSALLFAVAHGDIGSFVLLFVIGIVLAVMRWRLGSIWPGMAVHALNNAFAAITILAIILH